MNNLGSLVRRWLLGWSAARGFAPAEEARGGLHVPVRDQNRHTEVIALDDDAVPALATEVLAALVTTWLTVPTTNPGAVTRLIQEAGLELFREECFMSAELNGHPALELTAGYAVTTTAERETVLRSRIEHSSGELAAFGTMTVIGQDAVADAINTTENHRRRGLASALMSALTSEATARGAKTGILIASPEGERLYTSLGWQRHASILVARKPL